MPKTVPSENPFHADPFRTYSHQADQESSPWGVGVDTADEVRFPLCNEYLGEVLHADVDRAAFRDAATASSQRTQRNLR